MATGSRSRCPGLARQEVLDRLTHMGRTVGVTIESRGHSRVRPLRGAQLRVSVDGSICRGHALGHLAAPDVLSLRDEDGHAFVALTGFTPEVIAAARRAATTCPEQAIVVED